MSKWVLQNLMSWSTQAAVRHNLKCVRNQSKFVNLAHCNFSQQKQKRGASLPPQ